MEVSRNLFEIGKEGGYYVEIIRDGTIEHIDCAISVMQHIDNIAPSCQPDNGGKLCGQTIESIRTISVCVAVIT